MREPVNVRPRQVQATYRDPEDVEWTCLLRDSQALPFEEHLPVRPVAHQGPDQANTPLAYWSSTTNRMIDAESYPERVWMTLLDFAPDVIAFSAQPMRLSGGHLHPGRLETDPPDFDAIRPWTPRRYFRELRDKPEPDAFRGFLGG